MATSSGVSTKEAIAEINALIAAFNNLAETTKGISTNSKKGLKELAENTAQLKTQAQLAEQKLAALNTRVQANSRGANSYAKQMELLRKRTEEASKSADKYGKELDDLEKKTNKSSSALGRLGGGFKALLSAYGIATGVQLFADITKEIYGTIKSFESLEFAMEQITSDSVDLANSQAFINDLVKDFGVEILYTAKAWNRFLTASRQSNVTLRDTEAIFRSVTKAGAVLALTGDEMNGVFLALEQMMSKGKVTTEELRRQLGERIPGAVGIMAAAIGVSVKELDSMLKKGEVLSAETLPKFARALEAAYGIEQLNNVENLTAAQGRLTTAWKVFQKVVFESEGWEKVVSGLGNALDKITYKLSDSDYKVQALFGQFMKEYEKEITDGAIATYDKTIGINKKYSELTNDINKKRLELAEAQETLAGKKTIDLKQKELDELINTQIVASKELDKIRKINSEAAINQAIIDYNVAKEYYDSVKDLSTSMFLDLRGDNKKRIKQAILDLADTKAKLAVLRKFGEDQGPTVIPEDEDADSKKKAPKYYDLKDIENYENRVKIAMLEMQKNRNDSLLKADVLFGEDLIAILNDNTRIELEIAKAKYDEEVRLNKKALDDRLKDTQDKIKEGYILTFDAGEEKALLEKQLADKDKIALKKYEEEKLKIKTDARLKLLQNAELIQKEDMDRLNMFYDYEVATIKRAYNESSKTKEDKEKMDKSLHELQYKRINDIIDLQITYNKALLAAGDLTEAEDQRIRQIIAELEAARPTAAAVDTDNIKTLEEKLQDLEYILNIVGEAIQSVADLTDAIFERRIQQINEEIEAEENKYNKLIELAANNDQEQVRLRKERDLKIAELEKKRAKEKKKQAIAEKANAILQIAINTAIGISKAVAEFPLTAGMPWAAIVAALGAVQIAAVIAQPIPKYKDGLKKAKKDHIGQINDGGKQEYIERNGSILSTTEKDALVQIKKGDTVHKSYEAMIAARQIKSNGLSNSKIVINNNNDSLRADIVKGIETGFKKVKLTANINYDADWRAYKQNTL